jgi:SAM-dependent methyltransferase
MRAFQYQTMKNTLFKTKKWLSQFAFFVNIYFLLMWIYKYPSFVRDYFMFRRLAKIEKRNGKDTLERQPLKVGDIYPQLFDNTGKTHFDAHYTYHPAWAARIIAKLKPAKHIDISSILHFSTLVSAFVPVEFYDYRPAEVRLPDLECKMGDLLVLPFPDNSVESISCMHTIEHVGLGRYGDTIDPAGDMKAAHELSRVVTKGGTFIFVVPVGRPRICFNAHRIYSYDQVMTLFPNMELREFSLVPDDFKTSGLIKDANPQMVKDQMYACGCFWFIKK